MSSTPSALLDALTSDNPLTLREDRAAAGFVDPNGRSALHLAVHHQATTVASWLIDHRATVDAVDIQGETPLMRAAWLGDEVMVRELLAAGASLTATSLTGGTPLHFAYAGGTPAQRVVQVLLDQGADAQAKDKQGSLPSDWTRQAQVREAGAAMLASMDAQDATASRTLRLRR